LIVEILSDSTRNIDRGEKKQIYQDIFRTPEYFLFDPETCELEGYRLVAGKYEPIAPDDAGRMRSGQLDLWLGVHEGQLRFYRPDGTLAPTAEEEALSERRRADEAAEELAQLRARLGDKSR
jgi:hypothetical protein